MIISASRRTDIPAFHASWFMDCIHQGRVAVKNPFNPRQETIVSLTPAQVDVIVFWTRDAAPLVKHLPELDYGGYRYIFLYTITGYGPPLETRCPPLPTALETFKRLSDTIGPERVIWRFDPIICIEEQGSDWIIARFEQIAQSLHGCTGRVIISFLDLYKKVIKRLAKLKQETGLTVVDAAERQDFVSVTATALASLAAKNKMEIQSCAEKTDLKPFGIAPGSCIDAEYLSRLFGIAVPPAKDKSQRPRCRCAPSRDIGTYNTCRHGCEYCYAED